MSRAHSLAFNSTQAPRLIPARGYRLTAAAQPEHSADLTSLVDFGPDQLARPYPDGAVFVPEYWPAWGREQWTAAGAVQCRYGINVLFT